MAAAYLYEPAARCRHVAAAVYDKVYVWGGLGTFSASHDGPDKTDIILKVDVLDVKVSTEATLVHGALALSIDI